MDTETKACCTRATGWGMVGIVIALAWGLGNIASGMSMISAFAVPVLVILAIIGVIILATLNVPWFNRLCTCQPRNKGNHDDTPEDMAHLNH